MSAVSCVKVCPTCAYSVYLVLFSKMFYINPKGIPLPVSFYVRQGTKHLPLYSFLFLVIRPKQSSLNIISLLYPQLW